MAREGHPTNKRGITLKHLGSSSVVPFSVSGCFVPREGQEDGEAADSISPPEMDGGRRDGGVSTEGVRKREKVA